MGEFFALLMAGMIFSAPFSMQNPSVLPHQDFTIAPPSTQILNFEPIISAPSVMMLDVNSGGKIWEKNAHDQRAIASLTKLMVALIIMENHDFSEVVEVPSDFQPLIGAKMRLQPGERIYLGDVMRGLLIPSGNDAAEVLAVYHSGSVEKFVEEMNRRAYFLGMTDTHFQNPHGLDEEGHYSSAADLAILAKKVLEYPELRTIAKTRRQTVTSINGAITHELYTTNQLLYSVFPVGGLKTGTTENAGECLITLVETHNGEVLVVVLGSQNRFYDTKALFSAIL